MPRFENSVEVYRVDRARVTHRVRRIVRIDIPITIYK